MYSIAQAEIQGFNGDNSGQWIEILPDLVTATGGAASSIITASNSGGSSSSNQQQNGGGTIVGGNSSTYSPGTRPLNTGTAKKEETNYLPWIIGGVGALLLVGILVMNNNNKKRR